MKKLEIEGKVLLITGSSGFIGYHLVKKLLEMYGSNISIIGIDNMNDYYDVNLKKKRLNNLHKISSVWFNNGEMFSNFTFIEGDISDKSFLFSVFDEYKPDVVVNLAAQAGVRYSIEKPDVYIESNIIGFYNILEAIRNTSCVSHLVFASSSSVYGDCIEIPYSEGYSANKPVSLYAATKKCDEMLAYSYSKLYNIPITGLRFFTVYGELGRPDMAYFSFTKKLLNDENINVFNEGNCERDFTYIDDIVEGIIRVLKVLPENTNDCPYDLYNIGNNSPVNLLKFIEILADCLIEENLLPSKFNVYEKINLLPMQKGDVSITYADVSKLEEAVDFKPSTDLRDGLKNFVRWYKDYYEL